MKNWPVWLFVIAVVVVVLFALNYDGSQDGISLNDLFPDENIEEMPDIEYEFVHEDRDETQEVSVKEEEPSTVAEELTTAKKIVQEPEQKIQAELEKPKEVAKNESFHGQRLASFQPSLNLSQVPFTIQVASFREKRQATLELKGIQAAGYQAFIVTKDLGDKGTWHRIYIGQFETKSQAENYLTKVKPKYKDSFVISPKK